MGFKNYSPIRCEVGIALNNLIAGDVSSKDARYLKELVAFDLKTKFPANENGSEEPFLDEKIKLLCYLLLPINPAVRN
jgi:hypothetical protein